MFPGLTITLHKTIQFMQIQIKLKANEMDLCKWKLQMQSFR